MKAAVLFVLGCVLGGCTSAPATKGQFTDLPIRSGFTRLYVYREKKLPGFAAKPTIHVDGQNVGVLSNGTYMAFYLPAGTHEVRSRFSVLYAPITGSTATITVPADEDLFLRFNIQMNALVPTKHVVYSEWETGFDIPETQRSRSLIASLELGSSNPEVLTEKRPSQEE